MKIIISPAMRMIRDVDSLAPQQLPRFLPEAKHILHLLQQMDYAQLKHLWKCNDAIAMLNVERLKEINLEQALTPAILAYEGIQYRYMAPSVFEDGHFAYISEHLRILSGLYGLLRPFDAVSPYRLEMQAKLRIGDCKDLYAFWGAKLAQELAMERDCILNLASQEYSKAVTPHLPKQVRLLSCRFGDVREGKLIENGTLCKMARGEMVRYLAEHNSTSPEEIKNFDRLNYQYSSEHSSTDQFVFLKKEVKHSKGWEDNF